MILVGKTMKSLWKRVGEGMDFENGSREPSSPNVAQKRKKHLQEKGEWGVRQVGGSIAFDSNEYAHLKKSKEEKGMKKAPLWHLLDTSSFDKTCINCKGHPKICLRLMFTRQRCENGWE